MVLNKHGQTLILFVILIPLILGMLAFTIDLGVVIVNKNHLKEVTKTIIIDNIDSPNEETIKDLMVKNDIDISTIKINIQNDILSISNEIEIDSIFGKVIGIKTYKIKIKMQGYKNQEKTIIEY